MRIPPLDVSHGPQVIELAFSDTHYVKSVTELYSQMTIVLVRTISFFIFSTLQNCFPFSSFLYSSCRTHLKPSLLLLPPGYFFGTPGGSFSCSILFAQNLELFLPLHLVLPLLLSFWINLTLNANFSDNSDSQYTVTGKVLTANSFAKANLRRLDHPD